MDLKIGDKVRFVAARNECVDGFTVGKEYDIKAFSWDSEEPLNDRRIPLNFRFLVIDDNGRTTSCSSNGMCGYGEWELVSRPMTTQFRQLIQHDEYQQTTAIHCNTLVALCHGLAVEGGWWHDPATGAQRDRNDGELICLMHSELSEAMEAVRKSTTDDHLPNRPGVEVELADAVIRIMDYAGARGLDIGSAMAEKLAYNATRADHTAAARVADGGKRF